MKYLFSRMLLLLATSIIAFADIAYVPTVSGDVNLIDTVFNEELGVVFSIDGEAKTMAASPNDEKVAFGMVSDAAVFCDTSTHEKIAEMVLSGGTFALGWSSDNSKVAFLVQQGDIDIVNAENYTIENTWAATIDSTTSMAVPNGDFSLGGFVGGYNGMLSQVERIDLTDGSSKGTVLLASTSPTDWVASSATGEFVFTASIGAWSKIATATLTEVDFGSWTTGGYRYVFPDKDGETMYYLDGGENTLGILDVATGEMQEIDTPSDFDRGTITTDGTTLLLTSSTDNVYVQYDLDSGTFSDPILFTSPVGVVSFPLVSELTLTGKPGKNRFLTQTDLFIEISWTPPEGVTSYEITRDGVLIATLGSKVSSYIDHNRDKDQSYTYGVSAFAGNSLIADGMIVISTD